MDRGVGENSSPEGIDKTETGSWNNEANLDQVAAVQSPVVEPPLQDT